jgi:hypothetical protein
MGGNHELEEFHRLMADVEAAKAKVDAKHIRLGTETGTNTPSALTATKEGAQRIEEWWAATREYEAAVRRLNDFVKTMTS